MPDNERDLRLAVLIDADNASRTAMKDVMAEVAGYGPPTTGSYTHLTLATDYTV